MIKSDLVNLVRMHKLTWRRRSCRMCWTNSWSTRSITVQRSSKDRSIIHLFWISLHKDRLFFFQETNVRAPFFMPLFNWIKCLNKEHNLVSPVTPVRSVVDPVTAVRVSVTEHPAFSPGSDISFLLAISPRVPRIVGLLHTHPWGTLLHRVVWRHTGLYSPYYGHFYFLPMECPWIDAFPFT